MNINEEYYNMNIGSISAINRDLGNTWNSYNSGLEKHCFKLLLISLLLEFITFVIDLNTAIHA